MPSICTAVKFLQQLIPTTLPIWDNQLKATITKYTIHQFQTMYVSHTEVGAIALGQNDKMLQLMAMLLSFVDTTRNSGATTSAFKPAIETVGERTQVLATCTETGTEGTVTYTIWPNSIQGVSAAAAEAAVDADTTSALDLIRAAEFSETLHEQHWHKHCSVHFNGMRNDILGHVQTLPILCRGRSTTSNCSSNDPWLLAQKQVVSNQLQVKYSKWVAQHPSLELKWLTTGFTYTFCRLVARLVKVTGLAMITQLVRQCQTSLQSPNLHYPHTTSTWTVEQPCKARLHRWIHP